MTRPNAALAIAITLALVGCADDSVAPMGEGTGAEGTDGGASGTDDQADDQADETDAGCDAAFELTCPADAAAECQGGTTPVSLTDPTPGCAQWTVTRAGDDAFELGATEVEFQLDGDGMTATCATTVTISDTVAPELVCPPMEVLVRREPGAEIVPPALWQPTSAPVHSRSWRPRRC